MKCECSMSSFLNFIAILYCSTLYSHVSFLLLGDICCPYAMQYHGKMIFSTTKPPRRSFSMIHNDSHKHKTRETVGIAQGLLSLFLFWARVASEPFGSLGNVPKTSLALETWEFQSHGVLGKVSLISRSAGARCALIYFG